MKNFIQPADVVDMAPGGAVASGAGVLIGSIFGVAMAALTSGVPGPVVIKGRVTLPRLSSETWTAGMVVYWDNTNSRLTLVSTSNTKVGFSPVAVASGPATADVVLNGIV